jgi:hypothetical protein
MGNTSIGHSKQLAHGDDNPFAVIFDPAEVDEGLDIPVEDIRIAENTLFPGLADPELCRAICFPFAQHYIADSPGCRTPVRDYRELISTYNKLADAEGRKTFSARTIVMQLALGVAVSLLVVAAIVLIV